MPMNPATICLLFRKPGRFFSIERIFHQLLGEFGKEHSFSEWQAPRAGASPRDLLSNILSARACKARVYHITGDIHYVALGLPRRRTILTIHDCVFLYNSRGLKRRLLKWLFLDLPVRHCQLITTISEATRNDILQNTRCKPEKIVVIPNPVNSGIYYTAPDYRTEQPRILFVGTTPNKNLERTIAALENISCRLDIVGKLDPAIKELLSQRRIVYTLHERLTDQEMADKYAQCDIVLFPSLFEGFGLPIIEGQKAGRPVITSELSPMKQVSGGAACLVDPLDPGSIRKGVLRVMQDQEYREQLVRDGLINVGRFSPATIALQYENCYQIVLTA